MITFIEPKESGEDSGVACFKEISRHSPPETKENH